MQPIRRITIIGTGNVATVLARAITGAGHIIMQIGGRDVEHTTQLAHLAKAEPLWEDLHKLDTEADLYIIAVADAAIAPVAASLQLAGKLVVHTAGSVPASVLNVCSERYGILYPLQSLRKEMEQVPAIPFLVDAAAATDLQLLQDFALTLSPQVQVASDEQRLKLHVAAVVVSNFTNHLYALAEQYCKVEQADFRLLLPLIAEVAVRLQHIDPQQAQTGPAVRNDLPTIERHLVLLEKHPGLQQIYKTMTESILKYRG
jgi:predicted short-subunit dehydrogenase-like oxidoreductase (DUF2520 family)